MDQTVTDLELLAEQCLSAARVIKSQLAAHGGQQPTYDRDSPVSWPKLDPAGERARIQLRCASKSLYELTTGPDIMATMHFYSNLHELSALRYVEKYDILAAVPRHSTISYTDLAAATKTDPEQLKQMVRLLTTSHILTERTADHVEHTSLSIALLDPDIRATQDWITLDQICFVPRLTDAIDKWGHGSQSPTQTGLNLALDTDKPMFLALEERPEIMKRFGRVMTWASSHGAYSADHLAAYPWSELPADATVVDVGGSNGHCMVPVLAANPTVHCIVQDLPKIISSAAADTNVIPAAYRSRVTFQPYNFYTPQPVKGAAVYFLRMVLHIVSDDLAASILKNIVGAMSPTSKIVIMDILLPAPGSVPNVIERAMRTQDVNMMLLSNARERDMSQWETLFAKVDQRLRVTNVINPTDSANAIIEVSLVDKTG